jgi:hypothetical protein
LLKAITPHTRVSSTKGNQAMNMTSRFSLLLSVAGLTLAGCSSPDEGGGRLDPPTGVPAGLINGLAGTTQQPVNPVQGQGGTATVGAGGVGGSTAVGQAGTAPVAAGGAGGAPAGTGEIPVGTGLLIVPDAEGWVDGSSNGLGIQGAFTAASDGTNEAGAASETGSTITLDTTTTPGSVCVSGNLAPIAENPASTGPEDAYLWSDYWGGSVGLNLRQVIPAGGGEALPASGWPRVTPAGQVTGFSYTLTGTAVPPRLRFTVDFVGKPAGSTFCQALPAGATSSSLTSVVQSCWEAGGGALPGADLLTIAWSIIPIEAVATPFNFCVSNVQAIVTP